MSEKIKLVAKAIGQHVHIISGSCDLEAAARAAIAAMREPTDEMIDAARDNRNYGDNGGLERHDFEQEYKQAIDAALVTEPAV